MAPAAGTTHRPHGLHARWIRGYARPYRARRACWRVSVWPSVMGQDPVSRSAQDKWVGGCTLCRRDPDALGFEIFTDCLYPTLAAKTGPLHAAERHHVA